MITSQCVALQGFSVRLMCFPPHFQLILQDSLVQPSNSILHCFVRVPKQITKTSFENLGFTFLHAVPLQIAVQFSFDGPKFAGDHVQMICVVTQGELPAQSSLQWTWQSHDPVNHQKGIQITKLGLKSSMLSIPELDVAHNGIYTCIVSHQGGNISKSIELVVNGKCL